MVRKGNFLSHLLWRSVSGQRLRSGPLWTRKLTRNRKEKDGVETAHERRVGAEKCHGCHGAEKKSCATSIEPPAISFRCLSACSLISLVAKTVSVAELARAGYVHCMLQLGAR